MSASRVPRAGAPWGARLALLPMAFTAIGVYLGCVLWTLRLSLSSSRVVPKDDFVGLAQYLRLFQTERWIHSLQHLVLFGLLFISASLLLGLALALLLDRQLRAEGLLRAVFLVPYAMSFVATGLVWQWMLNPALGLPAMLEGVVEPGVLHWIVDPERVMYAVVLAAVWQASGVVMAVLLAGLRSLDESAWQAARVDGVPRWRYVLSVVLPQLGPSVGTAFMLLAIGVVKVYDVVVAMTQGGPGDASEVPAKFIVDNLFGRANVALASAAAVVMLASVLALMLPWWYARALRLRQERRA